MLPPPMHKAPRRRAASANMPVRVQLPMVVTAVIGLVLAVFCSSLMWRWEQRAAHQEFVAVTQSQVVALQRGLDEYLNQLQALRALFESSDDVTRPEFESFAGRLLARQNAIQNLSWVPRVKREERTEHELHGLAVGLPNYRIRAVTLNDGIVIAPEKNEYFPIFYSSLPVTSRIYGIDLLSQQGVGEHLLRARDEDTLSAVPDFVLHSRDDDVHAFLFSLPVYRRHMPRDTVEQRRAALAGFAHGAFITGVAMEQAVGQSATARGLNLYLFVDGTDDDARPIHGLSVGPAARRAELATLGSLRSQWHATGTLVAGPARWMLVATPVENGPLAEHHDRSGLVLIAGLVITALVVLFLRSSIHHAHRLLRANEEISSLAHQDPLTGLDNRRAFNERLAAAFSGRRGRDSSFTLLYFDLDHFKDVNDTLGHPIGDMLLQQVATRVSAVVRRDDVVARVGGDEFFILQPHADEAMAAALAARINQTLAEPFLIQGNDVHVASSIGIARCTKETPTADMLIVQADLALYRAKGDGRNCFRFHSEAFDREVHERVSISDDLRGAVDRGELCLYYQPQIELASGRIVGAEALLRWKHPERGLVNPGQFIPIAERTGAIMALGEFVISEACRQLQEWNALKIAPNVLAINCSASQFKAGGDLIGFIGASVEMSGVTPSQLEVELTESVLMEVTKQHNTLLARLRQLGVRIAIDDFGTGYSSLSYLTSYPFSRLKIAQELVFDVTREPRNATVVRAAIRLADELGIECIAEGIETPEQAAFLVEAGCKQGQGFLFGRPVEAAEMTALLRERREIPEHSPAPLSLVG
jgi:diguanylate cyclase (GGDEF)-like protein